MGLLLQQQGRDSEAVEYLRLAVSQMEAFGPSWLALARSLATLDWTDQLRDLPLALIGVGVEPPSTEAIIQALACEVEGELNRAEEILLAAWERFNDLNCLDELARMLTHVGRIERAREVLTLLNRVRPRHSPTLFNLGSITFEQGERDAGIGMLREALEIQPGAPHVQIRLQEMLALERQSS